MRVCCITADILGSDPVIMPSVMLKDVLTEVCGPRRISAVLLDFEQWVLYCIYWTGQATF